MSVTKLKTEKLKSDRTIGNWVNISISGVYALIILTMSAIQLGSNLRHEKDGLDRVIAIEVFFLKDWFTFAHPWSGNHKTEMTIFDFSQITLCVVLFIFCAMNLFILKETVLLYAAEVTIEPGALSKLLDKK